MPSFSYLALDRGGREHSGVLEADSLRAAGMELRRRSLRVVRLHEGGAPRGLRGMAWQVARELLPARLLRRLPVRSGDQIFFFYQLALMVSSGSTVVDALKSTAPLCGKLALERASLRMVEAIHSGASLSQAMQREGRLFPPLAAALVAAGEASGDLALVLERLADSLERSLEMKRNLFSATLYPSIVMLSAVLLMWALLRFVVPAYAKFFAGRRQAMPFLLGRFIALSDWLEVYGLYLAGGLGLGLFLILAAYTTARGKFVIDVVLLRLPLVGYALRTAAMARFSQTLAMLLASGLTMLEGLEVVARVTDNASLARSFRKMREEIVRGRPLTSSVRQANIPPLICQMVGVGERSGELSEVLAQAGRYYDRQLTARVKLMITWLEPAMILVVGGMVGLIYFAIYQAILRAATGGAGNI
ncbi:Type II secretion system F family protein [Rhodovastum atsumiense]|nr:type II secretion system F family protein [Rhodovastum atsumiense]CAH2602660.1 Type II secretion system F family protein [Rhodovastum atsumiense]